MQPYLYFSLGVGKDIHLKECPLNNIEICVICTGEHSTEHCPSLPRLKVIYQGGNETT
jgi:hypothetical protein